MVWRQVSSRIAKMMNIGVRDQMEMVSARTCVRDPQPAWKEFASWDFGVLRWMYLRVCKGEDEHFTNLFVIDDWRKSDLRLHELPVTTVRIMYESSAYVASSILNLSPSRHFTQLKTTRSLVDSYLSLARNGISPPSFAIDYISPSLAWHAR